MADNLDWEFIQSVSENQYSLAQLNKRLIIPTRDEEAARIAVEYFRSEERHSGIVYCHRVFTLPNLPPCFANMA